jgi:insulysin
MIKPKIDTNEYKYITLPNKLNVLLIYDKNTFISSAAMTVNVGFYNDPDNAQGLAHFLEHMLFMGTSKFPKENYYGEFINKSGGSTNAHTMEESTTYYFEVLNEYFYELVNIFSNFFISPLLSENAIEREINAINSEYLKNYPIDIVRIMSALKSLMDNPNHPYKNFGFGNTQTLLKPDIRTTLQNFYDKYYSSNIMDLVILSNNPISDMEDKITQMFSPIPNKNIDIPCKLPQKFPYTTQKFIKVVPIENKDILYIFFQVPSPDKNYKYKHLQYIMQLLGHRTQGGLYNVLKCNTYDSDTSFTMLGLSIKLTVKGLKHYDHIIDCVKTYIDLINKSPLQDIILKETKILNEIAFDYLTIDEKITYTSALSMNMLKYKPEDIIYGDYCMNIDDMNTKLINDTLKYITIDKSMIVLSSKEFANDPNIKIDKWFNTEFIPSTLSITPINQSIKNALKLPSPNPYIPQILTLNKNPITNINQNKNIWTKFDTFNIPKIFIDIIIYTNEPFKTPLNYIIFDIYLTLLSQYNHEQLYYANICETGYTINYDINFVMVTFYGFNSTISKIINLFTDTFFTFAKNITQDQFDNAKKECYEILSNGIYDPLHEIANDKINDSIYKNHYSNKILIESFKDIKYDHITMPIKWLQNNCDTKILVYGNFDPLHVSSLTDKLNIFFSPRPIILNNFTIPLLPSVTKIHIIKSQNPENDNNLIHLMYEIGPIIKTITDNWALNLLCTYFINTYVKEKFFTQLRTQEQSGYIVKSFIKSFVNNKGQLYGISFLVQSPHLNPMTLRRRIKKFVKSMYASLLKINQKKFDQFKNNIKLMLEQKFTSQYEEHEFIFNQMLTNEYVFNYKELLIEQLPSLTISALTTFYNTYFIDKNTRKIRVFEIYKQKKLKSK